MWDLSSPTGDRTRIPCIGRWILSHWTTREVPQLVSIKPVNSSACLPAFESLPYACNGGWLPSYSKLWINSLLVLIWVVFLYFHNWKQPKASDNRKWCIYMAEYYTVSKNQVFWRKVNGKCSWSNFGWKKGNIVIVYLYTVILCLYIYIFSTSHQGSPHGSFFTVVKYT